MGGRSPGGKGNGMGGSSLHSASTESKLSPKVWDLGPLFMLYNAVLRAMATEEKTATFGVPEQLRGRSVRGRYTTTLQAINSGVIKLSRMQPACKVGSGVTSQLSACLCCGVTMLREHVVTSHEFLGRFLVRWLDSCAVDCNHLSLYNQCTFKILISSLAGACCSKVYRGIKGMKLPSAFLTVSKSNCVARVARQLVDKT